MHEVVTLIETGATFVSVGHRETILQFHDRALRLLVGGGYASGRNGQANTPFFYMMLLFDVSKVSNTPYTDGLGNPFPIIRAGLTIPLFQGPKIGYR